MNDTVANQYELLGKFYPNLNVTQMGLVILMLGSMRATMGHEHALSTLRDYVNTNELSDEVKLCCEFLEREIFAIRKSRIDIDVWKTGNKASVRDN